MGAQTLESARRRLEEDLSRDKAYLEVLQANKVPITRLITIGSTTEGNILLTTAVERNAPAQISHPMRSIWVEDADTDAYVYFLPVDRGRHIEPIKLRRNDSFDFGLLIPGGYLYWDAQAGKTIKLRTSLLGSFRPGSQISVNAGGVNENWGSSWVTAKVSATAGAAVALFAADTSRKFGRSLNEAGYDLFVGPTSSVNGTAAHADRGEIWPSGALMEHRNTAALYVFNPGGSAVDLYTRSDS